MLCAEIAKLADRKLTLFVHAQTHKRKYVSGRIAVVVYAGAACVGRFLLLRATLGLVRVLPFCVVGRARGLALLWKFLAFFCAATPIPTIASLCNNYRCTKLQGACTRIVSIHVVATPTGGVCSDTSLYAHVALYGTDDATTDRQRSNSS